MQEFDATEQELAALLQVGHETSCPSIAVLQAAGQDVLPAEAEAQVQRHLQMCPLCAMLLADLATLPEPPFTQEQQRRLAAILPVTSPPASSLPLAGKARWTYLLPLAALLLASIALFFGFRPRHPATPALAAASAPSAAAPPAQLAALDIPLKPLAPPRGSSALLMRGSTHGVNPSDSELLPAFTAYNRADYKTAAARFQALRPTYPSSDLVALYLGVSQLYLHAESEAVTTLAPALQSPSQAHRDAATWYTAIALEHTDPAAARKLLATLCGKPASVYAAERCHMQTP